MSPTLLLFLTLTGFAAACVITALFRRYALKAQLLDHPNARSSHVTPTPRGGGVAFVLAFLPLLLLMGWWDASLRSLAITVASGGLAVAAIGFADDRHHVSMRLRLTVHMLSGIWLVAWMVPMPAIPMLGVMVDLGFAAPVLCVFFLGWMVNLFNFMDGIDGIASVEAITVALGGAWVWWLAGQGSGWMVACVFAACVAGFLAWNWPPARIFMGDAGSGFLGFGISALALWCSQGASHLFWAWFILIGCFWADATTTFVRRVARGSRFDQPHRTHAYQYASRAAGRHLPVTLAVAAINLLWLLPVATLVALRYVDGVVGVLVAYAPLVWLVKRLGAGLPEPVQAVKALET
jgi:Fuc2NAc and GlcNAc transferase